jgi:hypothetical protein
VVAEVAVAIGNRGYEITFAAALSLRKTSGLSYQYENDSNRDVCAGSGEKWELAQEKAQLQGQVRQMQKMTTN